MKFPIFRQTFKHPSVQIAVDNAKKYIDNHIKDPNTKFMHFCPYCGAPLEATKRVEKLESLAEHVTCSEVTPKTVYKCSAKCGLSETSMWNWEGEMYTDFPKGLTDEEWSALWNVHNSVQKTCFGAKYNNFPNEALGSFAYKNTMEIYTPLKKKEFPIKLIKNQKHVPVITRNYEFDEFGKALAVYYDIEWRKYNYDNKFASYGFWNPWFVQISKCLKSTKRDWKAFKQRPTDRNFRRLYGINNRHKNLDDRKGFEKIYYKYLIPFIFGKMMGIKNIED